MGSTNYLNQILREKAKICIETTQPINLEPFIVKINDVLKLIEKKDAMFYNIIKHKINKNKKGTVTFTFGDKFFANCLSHYIDCFLCIPKNCNKLNSLMCSDNVMKDVLRNYVDMNRKLTELDGTFKVPDNIIIGYIKFIYEI